MYYLYKVFSIKLLKYFVIYTMPLYKCAHFALEIRILVVDQSDPNHQGN